MFRFRLSLLAGSLLLASAPAAWPQVVRPANPLDVLPPVPVRPAAQPRATAVAPQAASAVPANQPVTPTRFDIEGVSSIPFAEVAKLFKPLTGKPTTAAALVAQAQAATLLYSNAGYALSFFFIPAQDFAGGVVKVIAVEGHIRSLRIEGDVGNAESQIRALSAFLLAERPLKRATFERITTLLGQMPGLVLQTQVPAPSGTDGASEMLLTARRKPVAVSVGAGLGEPRSRAVLTGELNGVLLPGGQLTASTLLFPPHDERYYAASYSQMVGKDGLVLKLSLSAYQADPEAAAGLPRGALERRATQRRAELTASYPLLLSASRSLTLTGGAYGNDSTDEYRNAASGAMLSDETRSRAAFLQLAYVAVTPGQERVASAMLVQGVDAAGARTGLISNVPGLEGPDGVQLKFTRILLQASQAMRWSNEVGASVSAMAQYGSHSMPSSERISFGGTRFGRGYAPGQTSGDSGWGVGLEINRRWRLPTGRPLTLEPYALLESARTRPRAEGGAPSHLVSGTVGLRLADQRLYTVDLGVSKPMGDQPLDNPSRKLRTNLLLSYRLDER